MKGFGPIRCQITEPAPPHDPAPPLLDCQNALQEIAKSCVHLIRNNRKAAIAADPAAIHKMRIELTQLRAVVRFFSPMTSDPDWPGISKELRWLNSALGTARDRDVTVNYARRKRYLHWARSSRHTLKRAQDEGHRRLAKKLDSLRYSCLIVALDDWITGGPWLLDSRSARSERLDAYSRAQLRAWRTGISREGRRLRALPSKQLHRLRIRCKRYRYVVGALQKLGVTIARQDLAFSENAKRAHRILGDLRDLGRLREAAHSRPPGYRKSERKLMQQAEKAFGGPR